MAELKKTGIVLTAEGKAEFIRDLKDVNAELRENYSALKLQEEQFGKNTSKQEKMAKLAPVYARDLELQTDKVRTLKSQLEELEGAEERNERAITNKRRELNYAEKDLNAYGKRVAEVEKKLQDGTYAWEDFADKLNKGGKKTVDAGKKMSVFSAAYAGAVGLAVKGASDWESAWAGVLKVTDGTEDQLKGIHDGIRQLASELPYTATEIAAVAEEAGKLGVGAEDVLEFTKVMLDMGVATDLTTTEAATNMAQFANIMSMPLSEVDRLGASLVELGNNFATTEPKILDMSLGLAGTGRQVGLTEAQIMAMATAMSTVGIEAAAGGTAMSKVMTNIQLATVTGGKDLEKFANVAGVTADEFKQAFEKDASNAILMFVDGLAKSEERGTSAIEVLDDMNIKETRLRDTLLRLTGANDIFRESLEISEGAWNENAALAEEAEIRYSTFESQVAGLKSAFSELAISFGEIVLPLLTDLIERVRGALDVFNEMSPSTKRIILVVGGLVAAIGPLLIFVGKIATGLSGIITLGIKLAPVFSALGSVIGTVTTFIAGLSLGWLALIAAVVVGVVLLIKNWDTVKEWISKFITWVSDSLKKLGQSIITGLTTLIENITTWLEKPFRFLENMFLFLVAILAMLAEAIWNLVKPGVDKVVELFNGFKTIITDVFKTVGDFIGGVFDSIVGMATGPIDKVKSAFSTLGGAIKTVFSGVKSFLVNIFSSIAGIIKAPINGIISAINGVLRTMNKIQVPKWVPGFGGKGINFGMIKMLAKGGNLLDGQAIIAEAGPELLQVEGGRAKVTPLTDGGGAKKREIIDYEEMGRQFRMALNGARFALDDDGFIRLIDDRLYEVM